MAGPVNAARTPVVGAISTIGRQRVMEDAISVRTNLCSPEINRFRPIHFFAVFDGHAGPHVAGMCSETMHLVLEQELMRMKIKLDTAGPSSSRNPGRQRKLERQRITEAWKRVLKRCFLKMDEMASSPCPECGLDRPCGCPQDTLGMTGSTAVVVVLTDEYIIVANCGDSRAALSRGGRTIPLSFDHKPDRQDERARIEAFGGRVVFADVARVQGILAMSRAIGDAYLKPFVTSEPEITFTRREPDDECLILATDGLWDVISGDMACGVARQCLQEEDPAGGHILRPWVEGDGGGAIFSSQSASAAALLARLALGRNSNDNISVVVVDLNRNHIG